MNQNNHPAIKHKLGLLELADQLKNVSRACKVMGVSRDTFTGFKMPTKMVVLRLCWLNPKRCPIQKTE